MPHHSFKQVELAERTKPELMLIVAENEVVRYELCRTVICRSLIRRREGGWQGAPREASGTGWSPRQKLAQPGV
ncbi:hypothetical protein soil367_14300 [Hydrocarboniclastica marina]|uniref:Uncharacterized protein n=1 Tax=Hydrocarboniclastica marina TaxID=2259620 RepID=A0A4P7XIT0_9ALTE|nr:hypothetical protein soil367_14300 [Hydrocarboniclastica marina]